MGVTCAPRNRIVLIRQGRIAPRPRPSGAVCVVVDHPGRRDRVGAHAQTRARSSVRMRTRSYAALAKVKIHATFSRPR